MNSETYAKKLTDPQWQQKRSEILQRDGWRCRDCRGSYRLHVHHICYLTGHEPWNYPSLYLVTLCEYCHARRHIEWELQIAWKDRLIVAIKKQQGRELTEHEKQIDRMSRVVETLPFGWWEHIRQEQF